MVGGSSPSGSTIVVKTGCEDEKIMKKFMTNAIEIVGAILTIALMLILFWLFLVITPDQYSAECDALREEMQQKGIISK